MTFCFTYQNKDLFYYNSHDEDLTCPYCESVYDINCAKIKSMINQSLHIKQLDLQSIPIRCIDCDLYNDQYPFKFDGNPNLHLNEEQKKIVEELYQEILITTQNNNTHNLFLIDGFAGTGKTSVVTYLLSYPEFNNFKICFSAPTNKALSVLMNKLNDNKNKNNDNDPLISNDEILMNEDEKDWTFKTVFKLLNNKMVINSQGETLFDFKQSENLKIKHEIIVIDEVSMVEKQQINHLLNLIDTLKKEKYMGAVIPIIIFLGDNGQLPPINENHSIIFDCNLQKKHHIKKLLLTKIMRSQNKITNLSLKVRQLIPLEIEKKIKSDIPSLDLKKMIDNQINYFNNKSAWIRNYAEVFKHNLNSQIHNKSESAPIMLVYTNPECENLNNICRNLIFSDPKEKFVVGELLVFNNYYGLTRSKTIANQKTEQYYLKFYTSEPIILTDVRTTSIKIDNFQYTSIFRSINQLMDKMCKKIGEMKVLKQKKDYLINEVKNKLPKWILNDHENKFITGETIIDRNLSQLCKTINSIQHNYEIYQLFIDGSQKLDILDTDPSNCSISVIQECDFKRYKNNCEVIRNKIKFFYDSLTQCYKNNQLMKFLIDQLFQQIWVQYYYRTYIWPFAEIAYGYAITTHKSQGSTYGSIYVDVGNILGCQKVNNIVKSKSLYTAITRAANYVNIYYQKQTLLPLLPLDFSFQCHHCGNHYEGHMFPSVNCTIDKKCADLILNQIKTTFIYQINDLCTILSDKNKNLYQIDNSELQDIHINDALEYVYSNNLIKTEFDKYQYSNLILALTVLRIKHI